ncbi:MAG: hypothetical protein PHI18_10595, partial [bacterium]|nr:hypothetical protein [bacterium]
MGGVIAVVTLQSRNGAIAGLETDNGDNRTFSAVSAACTHQYANDRATLAAESHPFSAVSAACSRPINMQMIEPRSRQQVSSIFTCPAYCLSRARESKGRIPRRHMV